MLDCEYSIYSVVIYFECFSVRANISLEVIFM